MYVEELSNTEEWENFALSMPSGTFYHSLKWKEVICKSYRHQPLYLVVKDTGGKVVGLSPGFITESLHTRIYDSIPHSDYGGPLIEGPHIARASIAILDFLRELSPSQGLAYARFLLMGNTVKSHMISQIGCSESNVGVMEIDLTTTPSQFIWNNIFSSHRRKKFHQTEKKGFQAREACAKSDLQIFYDLYLKDMTHIGARPRPYSFMENAWDALFPSNIRLWILDNKEPVAAKFFFKFAQKSFSVFVGLDRHVPKPAPVSPVDYLTWHEIKKAEEEGFSCVSMGTTPNDPHDNYFVQKSQLGGKFHPQSMIWTPLSSSGQILVQMRSTGVHMWKKARSFLPSSFTRTLEGKLDAL